MSAKLAARALLVAVVVTVVTAAPSHSLALSQPESGERFGIRLLDVPTDRADDPRAHQYVIDHLEPGATIARRVELSNLTSAPLTLSLYAGTASVERGAFHFGEGGSTNHLTAWTHVEPSSLTLGPGDLATATVTIAVPQGATGGEHYGVVWAEAAGGPPDGGGVAVVNRVGIRMYVSIGAGPEPSSDFEIRTLRAERDEEGRPMVHATVENTGGRALDLTGHLSLTEGPGGLTAGPFTMQIGTTLAPGETAAAAVPLDSSLPDGPWVAAVTVRSGTIVKRAEATVRFPSERAQAAAPVKVRAMSTDTSAPLRLALASAVTVAMAGGLLLLWFARRGRPRSAEATGARRPRARRRAPAPTGPPRMPRPSRDRVGRPHRGAPPSAAPAHQPPEPPGPARVSPRPAPDPSRGRSRGR